MNKRRRKRKLLGAVQRAAVTGWDTSLRAGDLVCLAQDGNVPHVYEIIEFHQRILMEHEVHNNPSLLAKGLSPGDEIAPFLVIQRVREAPGYREVDIHRSIVRKVDATEVTKVTLDQIDFVISNLREMAKLIMERDKNGLEDCQG